MENHGTFGMFLYKIQYLLSYSTNYEPNNCGLHVHTFVVECLHVASRERVTEYRERADKASEVGHLPPLLLDVH